MTLDNAANIAELIGGIVVLGGLAFAIVQLAQLRRQRRDLAAIELARSFSNPAFAGALQRVLDAVQRFSTKYVPTLKRSSAVEYRRILKTYVSPRIGTLRITDVTRAHRCRI